LSLFCGFALAVSLLVSVGEVVSVAAVSAGVDDGLTSGPEVAVIAVSVGVFVGDSELAASLFELQPASPIIPMSRIAAARNLICADMMSSP
jgi:hypothetical protein